MFKKLNGETGKNNLVTLLRYVPSSMGSGALPTLVNLASHFEVVDIDALAIMVPPPPKITIQFPFSHLF